MLFVLLSDLVGTASAQDPGSVEEAVAAEERLAQEGLELEQAPAKALIVDKDLAAIRERKPIAVVATDIRRGGEVVLLTSTVTQSTQPAFYGVYEMTVVQEIWGEIEHSALKMLSWDESESLFVNSYDAPEAFIILGAPFNLTTLSGVANDTPGSVNDVFASDALRAGGRRYVWPVYNGVVQDQLGQTICIAPGENRVAACEVGQSLEQFIEGLQGVDGEHVVMVGAIE